MLLRSLFVALVVASPATAQSVERFDLLCKHDGTFKVGNGKTTFIDPLSSNDRHYSVDLGQKKYCIRDGASRCDNVSSLTYDSETVIFGEHNSVNRRSGLLFSSYEIGGTAFMNFFKCEGSTFTPFSPRKF